jgi:hypothetical protein
MLKRMIIITGILLALIACATTRNPNPNLDQLFAIRPDQTCERESAAAGWDLRAKLTELKGETYLVLHFDAGFNLVREPSVELKAGFAVLEGQNDHTYVYKVGKLPNGREIAVVSFPTPARQRMGNENVNQIIRLSLERRENQDCLRVIEER